MSIKNSIEHYVCTKSEIITENGEKYAAYYQADVCFLKSKCFYSIGMYDRVDLLIDHSEHGQGFIELAKRKLLMIWVNEKAVFSAYDLHYNLILIWLEKLSDDFSYKTLINIPEQIENTIEDILFYERINFPYRELKNKIIKNNECNRNR